MGNLFLCIFLSFAFIVWWPRTANRVAFGFKNKNKFKAKNKLFFVVQEPHIALHSVLKTKPSSK